MKKTALLFLLWAFTGSVMAFNKPYEEKRDSIIILFGKKTRITIRTEDKAELQALKKYDLNAIISQVIESREKYEKSNGRDTTFVINGDTVMVRQNQVIIKDSNKDSVTFSIRIGGESGEVVIKNDNGSDKESRTDSVPKVRKYGRTTVSRRTTGEWYLDIGLNNYLTGNGSFPDQRLDYALRPLGSRYVAFSYIYKTRIGGKRSPLSLTYGLEASFYNFMFDSDKRITKGNESVEFAVVPGDGQIPKELKKSKLTAIYVTLPVMPVFHFGHPSKGFRFGVGGFLGYRLHSYSKIKDSADDKDHQRSNFYLNNLRYGVQALVGVRGLDLFFKYDLNPLFADDRGPDPDTGLRAIAFGIRF